MRIFSGIQPTGDKHLGNYIGAIRQYVSYQEKGDALYCVVDLHALTTLPDPEELRESSLKTAAILLASGLDPERCALFVQSHVAGPHCELTWLLSSIATYGELQRMTQFKDKAEGKKHIPTGLFTYPVLMAADILLYDTHVVPVGADQKQHIELARNIAERFNNRYGDTFVVPEAFIPTVGARIMDLQEPTRKMSTSGGTEKGTVGILESDKKLGKKLRSAVTDSGDEVYAAEDKPGITNLLDILSIATGTPVPKLEEEYRTSGYGRFKVAVADAVIAMLQPVKQRYEELMTDRGELERLLRVGADKALALAVPKCEIVRERVGCLR